MLTMVSDLYTELLGTFSLRHKLESETNVGHVLSKVLTSEIQASVKRIVVSLFTRHLDTEIWIL